MNRRKQGVQNILNFQARNFTQPKPVISKPPMDTDSTFNWNVVDSNVASFLALNSDVYMEHVHGTHRSHRSLTQYLSGNGQIAVT